MKDASGIQGLLGRNTVYANQMPVALFNSALARLQQRLEKNDDQVDESLVMTARYYINQAIEFYDREVYRLQAHVSIRNA